jgi:hypothetical protein
MADDNELRGSISLTSLITAAGSASARSRATLLTIVFVSIMAFSATWKSRPNSWLNMRSQTAALAVEYIAHVTENGEKQLTDLPQVTSNELTGPDAAARLDRLERGRKMAELRGIHDLDHAREYRREIEHIRLENVALVRVPLLGVTFDVNDSGMLAGIAFVVLLMLQRIALSRECDCLQALRSVMYGHSDRHAGYVFLAMTQVLTLPERAAADVPAQHHGSAFWKHVSKALVWLPVAVHLGLFANDIATLNIGMVISESGALIGILVSFAAIGIIVILAWQSMTLLIQIDRELLAIEKVVTAGA